MKPSMLGLLIALGVSLLAATSGVTFTLPEFASTIFFNPAGMEPDRYNRASARPSIVATASSSTGGVTGLARCSWNPAAAAFATEVSEHLIIQ